MGEAIIGRYSGGGGTTTITNTTEIITPVAGVCILNLKIIDSLNQPVSGCSVTCVDGSYNYTYNTNENGVVKFTTNSGQCNVFVNNHLNNNVWIMDHVGTWYNMQETPVGSVVNNTLALNYQNGVWSPKNGNYVFLSTSSVNINIAAGGGGGGGCAWEPISYDDDPTEMKIGNGGNGGWGGNYNGTDSITKNTIYYVSSNCNGGSAGWDLNNSTGYAGGGSSGATVCFGTHTCYGGGGGGGGWVWNFWRYTDGSAGTSYGSGGHGGVGGCYNEAADWRNIVTTPTAGSSGWYWLGFTKSSS